MKRRGGGSAQKPHLRFDKVVARLMERLQASAEQSVPDGTTVLVTVTAPVRLAAKTAASLEGKIESLRDADDTIHGNRISIRVLKKAGKGAPKLIGFVHNPETDPVQLLNVTRELAELAGRPGGAGLVAISPDSSSWLEAYRFIYSQLRIQRRITVVFADGREAALN